MRQSLLAILDQGPCYGYQLRSEFGRRTGSTWPLNVGQIYNTLERLRRDGLVAEGGVDDHGHVYWQITDAGSAAVTAWIDEPVTRSAGTRDELAVKIALAVTLPGVDVDRMLSFQRVASEAQLRTLRAERADTTYLARSLVLDALVLAAAAEVQWLDGVAHRLAESPGDTGSLALSTDQPKRGRPARAAASVA